MLENFDIQHQGTVAYTPKQNGKAEKEKRTDVEAARTMLNSANREYKFWAVAVNTEFALLT